MSDAKYLGFYWIMGERRVSAPLYQEDGQLFVRINLMCLQRGVLFSAAGMYLRLLDDDHVYFAQARGVTVETVHFYALDETQLVAHRLRVQRHSLNKLEKQKYQSIFNAE